jgi:hypothetical protein
MPQEAQVAALAAEGHTKPEIGAALYYKDWGQGPVVLLARLAAERRHVGRADAVPPAEPLPPDRA